MTWVGCVYVVSHFGSAAPAANDVKHANFVYSPQINLALAALYQHTLFTQLLGLFWQDKFPQLIKADQSSLKAIKVTVTHALLNLW